MIVNHPIVAKSVVAGAGAGACGSRTRDGACQPSCLCFDVLFLERGCFWLFEPRAVLDAKFPSLGGAGEIPAVGVGKQTTDLLGSRL